MSELKPADFPRSAAFNQALGELIISWTNLEDALHRILGAMMQSDRRLDFLTQKLGADALITLLRDMAPHVLPAGLAANLIAAMKVADRLRLWRNFYVHGIIAIDETTGAGIFQSVKMAGSPRQPKIAQVFSSYETLIERRDQVRGTFLYLLGFREFQLQETDVPPGFMAMSLPTDVPEPAYRYLD